MATGTRHAAPAPPRLTRIVTKGLLLSLLSPGLSPPALLAPPKPLLSFLSPRGLHHPASPPGSPWASPGSPNSPGPILLPPMPLTACWPSCHPPGCHPPRCHPLCPLLSTASQGHSARGKCSGLCPGAPGCPRCSASQGRGHLGDSEWTLGQGRRVRPKRPMATYAHCRKPMHFPTVPHPHLIQLCRGGRRSQE